MFPKRLPNRILSSAKIVKAVSNRAGSHAKDRRGASHLRQRIPEMRRNDHAKRHLCNRTGRATHEIAGRKAQQQGKRYRYGKIRKGGQHKRHGKERAGSAAAKER